jgi:hypothetical protein
MPQNIPWLVLRTRSHHEKKVRDEPIQPRAREPSAALRARAAALEIHPADVVPV